METIINLVHVALSLTASTYGFGEYNCGNIGRPVQCVVGKLTASGEIFDPKIPSAAVPMHTKKRMKIFYIKIKNFAGQCVTLKINDKKNPRYIGKKRGGLDLSPAAQSLVTGKKAVAHWSGKIELCDVKPTLIGML